MKLTTEFTALRMTRNPLSVQEYLEFRQINQSFAAVGAYRTMGGAYTTGEVNLMAGGRALRVRSISVDADLLKTLGVQPAQGRIFSEEETNRAGGLAPPLAILSYELWQTAFGGQPVLGQAVNVDGRPHEILGIMPSGIDVMDNHTAIWLPLGLPAAIRQNRGFHILHVIGRLKDGVTAQAAQTELNALVENWGERTGSSGHVPTKRPTRAADHTLQIEPVQDAIVGDARRSIWILQGAVGFVLLIACANLANLLMARAESRRREFAVRAALGASRSRLLRQTMTEGVMLCVAGGMLGLWLARVAVQGLIGAFPTSVPRMSEIAIDRSVLLFALGVSMATGVLFGVAPVAQRRIDDLVTAFKEGGDRGAIVAGRSFKPADAASPGRVVIVNETLANRIWKGRNPIGQRVWPNLSAAIGFGGNSWHTVIGVAKDVKQGGVEKPTGTELYVSLDQLAMAAPTMNVVLRTILPPAALSRTLERLVREVDPAVPIVRLRDMESVFAESIRRPRLLAQLLGAFAGLALLLAAVGTYGVLSYMATERRREIGIRIALGAARSSVLALVMKQGLQLTIIGVVVGLAGALGLNRLIGSVLFGVQPTDPTTLAAVTMTITLVAAGACWLPAWRASRLDPNVVLRAD